MSIIDAHATEDGRAVRCDIDGCTNVLVPGDRSTPPGPWTTDQAINAACNTGWMIDIFTKNTDKCPDHARAAIALPPLLPTAPGCRAVSLTYRYTLSREVELDLMTAPRIGSVHWIMLNPSTANDKIDDPTIRRVKGFTARLGYRHLSVVNLYAWRATKPADLWDAENPVGPENDHVIHLAAVSAAVQGSPIIAAWGAHAKPERVGRVLQIIREAHAMGYLSALSVTKSGAPGHPLYLPADAPLRPWPQR